MDDKLNGAKIFQNVVDTPIAINENGYIGIDPSSYSAKIFSINEVIEYKIKIGDTKKNTAGGIGAGAVIGGLAGLLVGGLLGAGGTGSYASRASTRTNLLGGLGAASGALVGGSNASEKISEINLVFKMNDFNNPYISVPLLKSTIKTNSNRFKELQVEIQSIISTLDFLKNNKKNSLLNSNQPPDIRGNEIINRNSFNFMQSGDTIREFIGGKFYILIGNANIYSVFRHKDSGKIAYYNAEGETSLINAVAHVEEISGKILSIITANKGLSGVTKELIGGISVIEHFKANSMREALGYIEKK
ncbi:MAG: hypothetical protein FWD28_09485 [Treponema sp.]|nr:hypothetical protein [Treponema sp.]